MEILNLTENEDGSANIEVDLIKEELQTLVEVGLNKILKEYVNVFKKRKDCDIRGGIND
jgi:hypothetical protein